MVVMTFGRLVIDSFSWPIEPMTRSSNVITATVGTGIGGMAVHSYSPGTQITILWRV